jgi:hypothetical protein
VTHSCTFCPLLDWGLGSEGATQANPRSIIPMEHDEAMSNQREEKRAECQEKLLSYVYMYPYRKPTQVDWASSLRSTGERSLRNSAKKLGVSSQYALPAAMSAAAKVSQPTVYQKHRSLQTRKGKYRG